MYLYRRFKIDVLGTSQGRHPTDVFSGRFEDVRRTFLQNFRNKQHLTFQYFTQHIWWVAPKINSNVFCILFKIDVLGTFQERHYADVTLGCNKDVLGTALQNLWGIGYTQMFLLPGGTLKLYFKML